MSLGSKPHGDITYRGSLSSSNINDQLNALFTWGQNEVDVALSGIMPPIGTIIPFYDFNGALTFNTTYWAYCNGQTKTVTGVGSTALPDLSNRYLVGFGTEGGADNGSAAWATAAIGNASHESNLQHSHTVDSHTHDLSNHTHTLGNHTHDLSNHTHDLSSHTHNLGSHTHDSGSYKFKTMYFNPSAGGSIFFYDSGGSEVGLMFDASSFAATGSTRAMQKNTGGGLGYYYTGPGSGSSGVPSSNTSGTPSSNTSGVPSSNNSGTPSSNTSGVPSSNTSGGTSPSTNNQLSTTQSIQPRSIRVRWLMRIT
jgi:hypothetical protein